MKGFYSYLVTILFVFTSPAFPQSSLVPERDWTSVDGKTIRASLIEFENGQGRFRTPEGRRFLIPDEKFSLRDQLPIFAARLESQFELSHSKDINTDFYYSRHIPANRRNEKNYSYVAFGPGRFNFAVFLNHPNVDFFQFSEVAVSSPDGQPAAIYQLRDSDRLAFQDNGRRRTRARISINYGRDDVLLKAVESALEENRLRFIVRGNDEEIVIEPDETEANSMRELIRIFRHGSLLVKEGFLTANRVSSQMMGMESPQGGNTPATTNTEALEEMFGDQLSKRKYGTISWKEKSVDGVGFLGVDVVIRDSDGNLQKIPFSEIAPEDRKVLFGKRLEEAFGDARFTHESGSVTYLHPDWDSKRMIYSQSILLVHHSDGNYYLRAHGWSSRFEGDPTDNILVRGDNQPSHFPIACRANESQKRERTDGNFNTTTQAYLDTAEAGNAADLISADSIEFRIRTARHSVTVSLKPDELEVTKEAVALFQWTHHL
ncbi:MAG: hypothetical protein MI807_11470 [Verrucomicrobiales bacterium]|nr:hypothetical protein [Verrucomicrobiales bacterium]